MSKLSEMTVAERCVALVAEAICAEVCVKLITCKAKVTMPKRIYNPTIAILWGKNTIRGKVAKMVEAAGATVAELTTALAGLSIPQGDYPEECIGNPILVKATTKEDVTRLEFYVTGKDSGADEGQSKDSMANVFDGVWAEAEAEA